MATERESINFKLPKSLANALRQAAKERNTTATDLVIQGLHHILGDVPGVEASMEVRLYQLEEEFFNFRQSIGQTANSQDDTRLTSVEAQLENLTTQLTRLESAMMQLQLSTRATKARKAAYPYQYNSQPPQLEPLNEERLAMRLSMNAPTLRERRETMGKEEFEKWCSDRDPSKRKWRYNQKDGLYHPVQ